VSYAHKGAGSYPPSIPAHPHATAKPHTWVHLVITTQLANGQRAISIPFPSRHHHLVFVTTSLLVLITSISLCQVYSLRSTLIQTVFLPHMS